MTNAQVLVGIGGKTHSYSIREMGIQTITTTMIRTHTDQQQYVLVANFGGGEHHQSVCE